MNPNIEYQMLNYHSFPAGILLGGFWSGGRKSRGHFINSYQQ